MASSANPVDPRDGVEVRGGQGVQIGDHNEQVDQFIQTYIDSRPGPAGPAVSSAYSEQVRRISPLELRGRDGELAELAAFCTEPGRGPYAWWRAPAWAGKSALMSWFVLHPPPGVRVISFFVTARYKGQDDQDAFIDAVLEQLAEILGESLPAYLTATTRELHLLCKLAEAAARYPPLVLVIDGLDEDRGVSAGPDMHSIAALLPARPPAGLRVIAAGRPDPPIPGDVPDDHPLRDQAIVRVLGKSRWAAVVKADMQRELKRLLHGGQGEQDLLGLVAVAGGGLTTADLAELSGLPGYEIEENLDTVAGRTFSARVSRRGTGAGPAVYVLGHEELQAAAIASLGPARAAKYRERLHGWAGDYRRRGWPTGTPEYLLRGYFRLLYDAGDVPRLLACATDRLRHIRMLEITGSDAAALTEITDVQEILVRHGDPDLPALARLNAHRVLIAQRNVHIPVTLPAVWAAIGHPDRAEALAQAITDPGRRVLALGSLIQAAAAGDRNQISSLAEQAFLAAQAITDPGARTAALAGLARVAADAGDLDRAEAAARAIGDPGWQARALNDLVRAAAAAGDRDRASTLAMLITSLNQRAQALADRVLATQVLSAFEDADGAGGWRR